MTSLTKNNERFLKPIADVVVATAVVDVVVFAIVVAAVADGGVVFVLMLVDSAMWPLPGNN